MTKFRTTILALTAIAALGFTTFASSSADARGHGGGGARSGGFHGGGARMGGGMRMGGFRGNMGGMRTNSFRPNRGFFGRDVLSQRHKSNWPGKKTGQHCYGFKHCISQNNWPNHRPWPRPGYPSSYTPSYTTNYVAPAYAAPTYAAAPSYSAPAPSYSAPGPSQAPASTCTCLRKSYQQDGSVLFQDTCTNEAAAAMPGQQQAQQQPPVQGGS